MNKKYELTNETKEINGRTLYRIKALKDFSDIKAGDLGGFIEKESNLSHNDDCWIYDNAYVFDDAKVYNNACIYGSACIYDNAHVYGNSCINDNVCVCDNAKVYGDAYITEDACIFGNSRIFDNVHINDNVRISGNAKIYDNVCVYGNTHISCNAKVYGNACIYGDAMINSDSDICLFYGFGTEAKIITVFRCKDGLIRVNCEWFNGTLEEFRKYIKEIHTGKIQKGYLLIVDVIEEYFK